MPSPAISHVVFPAPSPALSRNGHNGHAPIVAGLIAPMGTTVLTGVSTTQFALHLAHAVASGDAFLGFGVPSAASVLYVGECLAYDDLRHRLTPLGWYFGEPKAALSFYSAKGELFTQRDLRSLVAHHHPELLILDSLLLPIEAAALAREFGCAVLLVYPCRTAADTIVTLVEATGASDYPTFTMRVRTNGDDRPFTIRQLGTLFRRAS